MITSGIFASKPTTAGEKSTLRPFTRADTEDMGPVLADPELLRLTGSVHTTAEAENRSARLDDATRGWYESRRWYESRWDQADRLDHAVADRTTDRCVGEVVLKDWTEKDDSCN